MDIYSYSLPKIPPIPAVVLCKNAYLRNKRQPSAAQPQAFPWGKVPSGARRMRDPKGSPQRGGLLPSPGGSHWLRRGKSKTCRSGGYAYALYTVYSCIIRKKGRPRWDWVLGKSVLNQQAVEGLAHIGPGPVIVVHLAHVAQQGGGAQDCFRGGRWNGCRPLPRTAERCRCRLPSRFPGRKPPGTARTPADTAPSEASALFCYA